MDELEEEVCTKMSKGILLVTIQLAELISAYWRKSVHVKKAGAPVMPCC